MLSRKNSLIFFFLLMKGIFLFADEESILDYSIITFFGIKNGSVNELVYENENQISKLVWDQSMSPQFGIDINFKIWRFFIKTQQINSIPIKSGYLEDFDYLTSNANEISHYSKHDSYLDKDFSANAQISFKIKVNKKYYDIYPLIGVTYQNRKWSAQDGFLQYPLIEGNPWTGNEPKQSLTGTVISYEQSLWYPYFGLENIVHINSSLFLGILAFYYPYVSIDSLDSHFLRSKQFYDIMRDGSGVKIEGWLVIMPFKTQKSVGIKIAANYENFSSYGNSSTNNIGINNNKFIQSDIVSSGTKSTLFSYSLGFIFNPTIWD
ncbi:MAG TPA: omptin family outer membrane protease [Edaphocola sp.]|nr:omptin family outer membrane protease [Edaphocola sp.]